MQRLTFFKKHPGIKGTFSDEEIMQFIELARPPGANEVSWNLWSLYFETLAFTGARPGEVAALTINDIDLGRKVIFFKYTKTEVPRAVGIAPDLLKKLEAHLPNCSKYIFTTKRGLMFSEDSWYHAFKRRKEILGIKRCNITPMSFRHSFATRMLEKDVNIYKVAKILGHDIKMTQQYEHLTTEDIRVAMNKHPLIRKQVKYSKEEIAQILQEVLNDIGLSYDMVTEKGELLLTIRCPCHSLM
jgi:integrase